MKKILSALAVAILVGCATNKTFQTLSATEQAVDIGYRAYMDLVIQGKLKTNNVPVIAHAYNDFQATMKAAVLLSQSNTNAPASQSVLDAASDILVTIAKEEGK